MTTKIPQATPDIGFKNSIYLRSILILGLLALISVSLFNFISHSELWSIAQGDLFASQHNSAISTYYRPLFYSLLKSIYFIPVDNVTHILLARFSFSLLAGLSLWLTAINVRLITQSEAKTIVFVLFLLSFQLYFYNIYRVRSDMMASLFILLAYTQVNLQYLYNDRCNFKPWAFPILCLLSFFCTPKAIYLIFSLFLYRFFLTPNHNKKVFVWNFLKGFVVPLSLLLIALGLLLHYQWIQNDPYVLAFNYHLQSVKNMDRTQWIHLLSSLESSPGHYALIFIGSLIFFFKKQLTHSKLMQAQMLLFLLACCIVIVHPEKWSYFLAPLIPFLSLPLLFLQQGIRSKILLGVVIGLFMLPPVILSHHSHWFRSNSLQIKTISGLENMFRQIPGATYFDSTGLLPREKSIRQFLGPHEESNKLMVLRTLSDNPPEFIFFTSKLNLAKPEVLVLLKNKYHEIVTDIWVQKEFKGQIKLAPDYPETPLRKLFIFDFLPVSRFRWLGPYSATSL